MREENDVGLFGSKRSLSTILVIPCIVFAPPDFGSCNRVSIVWGIVLNARIPSLGRHVSLRDSADSMAREIRGNASAVALGRNHRSSTGSR